MNTSSNNSDNHGRGNSGGVDGTQPPVPSLAAASALTHVSAASAASAVSDGAESSPPATENDEMQLELDDDANEIPMQHDCAAMLHEADIACEKKSGTEAEGNVPLLANENEEMKLELDEEINEAPTRDAQIASQFEADEKPGTKKKVELDEDAEFPMADAQIASQIEAGKKPAATAATSGDRGGAIALHANQRSTGERVTIPLTLPPPTLEVTSPTNNNDENSPPDDEENPPLPDVETASENPPTLEATLVQNVEATLIVPSNSPPVSNADDEPRVVYMATQVNGNYKKYSLAVLVSLLIGGMATAIAMLAVGNSSNGGDEVNMELMEQTPVTIVPEAEEDDAASDMLVGNGNNGEEVNTQIIEQTPIAAFAIQSTGAESIYKITSSNDRFKTLTLAIQAAGLEETLSEAGTYTIFAPTNAAFAVLPEGLVAKLLKPRWLPQLTDLLAYHALGATVASSALATTDGAITTKTLNGEDVTIDLDPVRVNDNTVIVPDVVADNGVIHVIDVVLVPTSLTSTIVDIGVARCELSTLVAAVTAAELAGVLSGDGPFTFFAPTNDAFNALPEGTVTELLKDENKDKLIDILKYHVVSGNNPSSAIASGDFPTLNGDSFTVEVMENGSIRIDDAMVTMKDVIASNGIIHVIDRVLMPPVDEAVPPSRG